MSIKVIFPIEKSTVTSPSLYQWDYGQILEIESADLSPVVEVHFACSGMTEAIVRPCTVNNGIATVPIPDICLEQSGTITAWVFEINGTEGMTKKTITIPVVKRLKPSIMENIPSEVYNRYTELITEINEAIKALTDGNVTVVQAKNANYAAEAGHANVASSANTASGLHDYASPTSERKIQIGLAGSPLPKGQFRYLAAYEMDSAGANTGRIKDVLPDNVSVGHANYSRMLDFDETDESKLIPHAGIYLVQWKNETEALITDIVFVSNLTKSSYSSNSRASAYYHASTRQMLVENGDITNVFQIGSYSDVKG